MPVNFSVLNDPSNTSLMRWIVSLQNEESDFEFECWAENEDHAVEQAMNAEPEATVLTAVLGERFFAMMDSEEIVEIRGVSDVSEAIDHEPSTSHWVFSESGLRAFLESAQKALLLPSERDAVPA